MRANMAATFSKAGSLCYLAFVVFVSIHLFNFYQTPNVSTTWAIPTFGLVGKPSSRSVNAPHRPITTWLKHGFGCVSSKERSYYIYGHRTQSWPISPWIIVFSNEQGFASLAFPIYSTERLRTCFNRQRQICSLCLRKRWSHHWTFAEWEPTNWVTQLSLMWI